MSTQEERITHAAEPGYWAVETRVADGTGRGRRYLCHADSDRMAFNMTVRLAGSDRDVLGFSYVWIDEQRLASDGQVLPVVGDHREVFDAREWDRLIVAHEAAEAALAQRQAQGRADLAP